MNFSARGYQGRGLETTIISSQRNVVCLEKIPTSMKFLPGGKQIPIKGPVDFIGEVRQTGRAIHFDAKQNGDRNGFYIHKYLEPHQEAHLNRHGSAGAICGLLMEATHPDVAAFFWMDWRDVSRVWLSPQRRVDWSAMLRLGDNKHCVKFEMIAGVSVPETERAA